jgi:UDP-N-acetylglucosamine--N-acetylmuramyl-(pentapeptide) pyrophosphoryl-undecaprenol N-acetylglucosamine transferase
VVFIKGGYVGLPVGIAAILLRIPIVTHDSDTMPGLTNRLLSRYAAALAVGAPVSEYPQYAGKNIQFTGVPVRDDFLSPPATEDAKKQLGIPEYKDIVVVVGGSLGAVRVNNAILANIDKIVADHSDRALLWFTGATSYDDIAKHVSAMHYANVHVQSFTDDLPTIFSAATVVITRAGATTLAELAVMKKPTIVIPNPLLTGGHQTKNAHMLLENKAALVVPEDELATLPEVLDTLLSDTALQSELQTNFAALSNPHASKTIAEVIIKTANGQY